MDKVFEEVYKEREEQGEQLVDYIRDVADFVSVLNHRYLGEFSDRVANQQAFLLVLSKLNTDTIEISKEEIDRADEKFVGKVVHVSNKLNDDGSRTITVSTDEKDEQD